MESNPDESLGEAWPPHPDRNIPQNLFVYYERN